MIELDILNFRNLRDLHLHDEGNLSIVAGANEAGKSSLIGAIQWCLTGTAFGLRGTDVELLTTHGETRTSARVKLGDVLVHRTRSGGDSIKSVAERLSVPPDVLPILFHQSMSGDGGNKHLKAFLQGAVSDSFDALTHFASDGEMSERLQRAVRSGARTVKQQVTFCHNMRASSRPPTEPHIPSVVEVIDADIDVLQARMSSARELYQMTADSCAEAESVHAALSRIEGYQKALGSYQAALKAASAGDPLGARRTALRELVHLRTSSLDALSAIIISAGFDDAEIISAVHALRRLQEAAQVLIDSNPAPPNLPVEPKLAPEDRAIWEAFGGGAVHDALREAHSQLQELRILRQTTVEDLDRDTTRYEAAVASRAVWAEYRKSHAVWEDEKASAAVEWQRWDTAAKKLLEAEAAHLELAGKAFECLITEFSKRLLGGRIITVSVEDGIKLGGIPIELVSLSTRWRVEVCVMAAIARYLNSPLFLCDGADILDPQNRDAFTAFVLQSVCPHFVHTIVTTTIRGKLEDEKPLPPPASKWTLEAGILRKLAHA